MLKHHPTLAHMVGRAGWYLLTFLVALTVNFLLPRLGERNPVDTIMAKVSDGLDAASARAKEEAYLKEFNLVEVDATGRVKRDAQGKPLRTSLGRQFVNYLGMSLRGDLGSSILQHPKRVSEIIKAALPWTLALQLPTIVFGWLVGNGLGALAAYKRGVFDRLFYPLALLASAIPAFCFGMLLVYVFGIRLEWFPAVGGYDDGFSPELSFAFLRSASYYYVLPFLSVFLIVVGGQAIGMRSMCIYELNTDYVRYAKLLGIEDGKILFYMFRNAMLPQLTGLALALGTMVGGALITEMIFSYPGLGMAVLTAIQGNDYPLISGCTLLVTSCVLFANFGVDVLVGFLDPRVRAARQTGK
ncbi:MAG TPA: ABC transporter permease [Polyangiaceae bacterium]|nr:ABC transporter permease [Polyangiaceae bacterium]